MDVGKTFKFDLWQESRQGDGTGGSLGSILLREEPADYPGRVYSRGNPRL